MLRIFPFFFLTLCVLVSCHTQQTHKPALPKPAEETVCPLQGEDNRRFNELFLEAICHKLAERVDAEYELLAKALEIAPENPDANYEMALLKLSFSSYSDTLSRAEGDSLLHKAVKLAPHNNYYKETLGIFLANSAKYHEAIQLYEELAEEHATTETLATLIWLYKQSGDYAGAIRTIDRLERLDGRSEALSMEKFQTYIAMKDDEHAYKAIEDLCAEYPLDLRYRVLLGDLYDQHGYHERAIEIYKDVLTADPHNSYAQLSLLAYYKAAEADSLYLDLLHRVVLDSQTESETRMEAMKAYAIDNINRHAPSAPGLALFRQALGQKQDTRDMAELCAYYMQAIHMPNDSLVPVMRKILEAEPDYNKARLQLLQIVLQNDDMTQAVGICREGEIYAPAEVTYYYYEGVALYRLGRDTEAISALRRGTEHVDTDTDTQLASDLYAQLGDVLHDCGFKQQAFRAYDHALTYNDRNLLCLNNYAYFLSLADTELEKAQQMSRRTVEAEPQNTTYLDTYAWVLCRMGQFTQARIYVDQLLRYVTETSDNASLFDHAGDIYYHTGDRQKALSFWKKALRLSAGKAERRRLQQKLRQRRP